MQTKCCTLCGEVKPPEAFSLLKKTGRRMTRCKPCAAAVAKEWRRQNPEKAREHKRRYRQGKGKKSEAHRRQRYGLTLEDVELLIAAQGGVCAICGEDVSAHNGCATHVDHDHTTGKVRGILCRLCNPALGAFRDDPVLLRRAAEYLERHRP